MMLADGIIDARELETLYKIGIESYGLTPEEISQSVKDAGTSFIIPELLSSKIELLYQMAQIALADDKADQTETNLMKKYALKMGFDAQNLNGIIEVLLTSVRNNIQVEEIIKQASTN